MTNTTAFFDGSTFSYTTPQSGFFKPEGILDQFNLLQVRGTSPLDEQAMAASHLLDPGGYWGEAVPFLYIDA